MTTDDPRIIGVWGLVAQVYEDVDTNARVPIFGDHPNGRQIATKDGRWLALATAQGRITPTTDAERVPAVAHRFGDRLRRSIAGHGLG